MGLFDAIASIGKKIGSGIVNIGTKLGEDVVSVGKKVGGAILTGLDYGIQGAKIATDFADKYTGGLTHFIPYYGAIKAGVDIADRFRMLAKGEKEFDWSFVGDTAMDAISGFGAYKSGAGELKAWRGVKDIWKSPALGEEAVGLLSGARKYGTMGEKLSESAKLLKSAYVPNPLKIYQKASRVGGDVMTGLGKIEQGAVRVGNIADDILEGGMGIFDAVGDVLG